MKVTLAYGKEGLPINLAEENVVKVLRLKESHALEDAEKTIYEKLEKPTDSKALSEIAKGRKSAAIVITDVTRPTPNEILLRPILKTLLEAGIAKDKIKIIIATGLHEPNEGQTLKGMIGDSIISEYEIINHNARDKSTLKDFGKTDAGSPVLINKDYVESDLKILTGLIEPHFMAGYSGGRKCICPGIAGAETIASMHSPKFLEDENSKAGIIRGNSFHDEILSVAKMAGGADFILNVIINEEKDIVGVVAGDMEKAHEEGIKIVESLCIDSVPQEADIVITTNSGYPLDLNFYQTVKGMVVALEALKEDGVLIIASRCHTGIGSEEFIDIMENFGDADAFLEKITNGGYFKIDQWQAEEFCKVLKKAKRIMIYTEGVDSDSLRRYGLDPIENVDLAIASLLEEMPEAKITVIPKGPYIIPKIED